MSAALSLTGHRGSVLCLDSPGGDRLVSGGEDGSARLWDLAAGRAARALLPVGGSEVNAVCLGQAGEVANWVFAATGQEVFGFDLRVPGVVLRQAAFHLSASRDEVGQLAINRSGTMLAAADDAGDVQLFDLAAAQSLPPLMNAHDSLCGSVAFNPTLDWQLVTGGMDAMVVEWDYRRALRSSEWSLAPPPEQASSQLLNPRHVHCLSYAPDGRSLAVALGDGSVEVRRAGTGEVITSTVAHRAATSQAHFAPELCGGGGANAAAAAASTGLGDGAVPLITAGDDARLRLWTAVGLEPSTDDLDGAKRRRGVPQVVETMVDENHAAVDAAAEGHGPHLRACSDLELPAKANWISAASVGASGMGARSGVVCVASSADAILVYGVHGHAGALSFAG